MGRKDVGLRGTEGNITAPDGVHLSGALDHRGTTGKSDIPLFAPEIERGNVHAARRGDGTISNHPEPGRGRGDVARKSDGICLVPYSKDRKLRYVDCTHCRGVNRDRVGGDVRCPKRQRGRKRGGLLNDREVCGERRRIRDGCSNGRSRSAAAA